MKHKFSNDQIFEILALWDIGLVQGLETFANGRANQSVKVTTSSGTFVLRVSGFYNKTLEQVHAEAEMMNSLKQHYSKIPEVYATKIGELAGEMVFDGKPAVAMLMEMLNGSKPAAYTTEAVSQIGQEMAALHLAGQKIWQSKTTTFPQEIREQLFETVDIQAQQNLDLKAFLQRGKDYKIEAKDFNIPTGLVHNDFNRSNLLFEGSQLTGILDFDDSHFGFLAQDVGGFVWNLVYNHLFKPTDLGLIKVFLDAYSHVRPLSPKELEALPQFIMLRNYSFAAFDAFQEDSTESLLEEIQVEQFLLQNKLIF